MGTALSCFPTERKNKDAIRLANASDREMMRDATLQFINCSVRAWGADGTATAAEAMLVHPKLLCLAGRDVQFYHAYQCVCARGTICKDDLFRIHGSSIIGRIIDFWQDYGSCTGIVAQLWILEPCEGSVHYNSPGAVKDFVALPRIGDALFHYIRDNVIIAI